jgi:predicted heme/steroid binding protein
MKKRHVMLLALLLALFIIQGCNSGSGTDKPAESELVLTLEELSKYDGKNGNSAYIAVDGVIYDVTDVSQWKNGAHNGFTAGQDLTDEIKNVSPHGVSKLTSVPVVGKLAEGQD